MLVIDDNSNILDLMTRMMKRAGYTVVTAGTGEEGLKIAREFRPGVITARNLSRGDLTRLKGAVE